MTDHLRKKIVVFSEGPVSIGSLLLSLTDSFRNTNIVRATSAEIKNLSSILDQNTLAFILPGITGEHSPFMTLLGREGNSRIRDYVENGGVFVGFCAGAYYACENISYQNPVGVSKSQRPGLDFFKATAKGPQPHLGREILDNDNWNDVIVTRLEYKNKKSQLEKVHVCYGNGPALTQIQDQDIKALAHYSQVPGKPVAVASKNVGKGLALFIGVHPEITSTHIEKDNALNNINVKRLIESLSPYEQERLVFWNDMMDIVKEHNINLGRAKKSVLRPSP